MGSSYTSFMLPHNETVIPSEAHGAQPKDPGDAVSTPALESFHSQTPVLVAPTATVRSCEPTP
jgi:hypothetical protein